MKKNLLLLASLFFSLVSSAQEVDENGYTTVDIAMQPAYANQVYFKLATNTPTGVAANSWDVAFQKAAGQSLGAIRINDFKVSAVYEVSSDLTEWADIDVTTQTEWTQLYNSVTEWSIGAFDTASDNSQFGYAWGAYDMGTHHVNGTRIFVFKYGSGEAATYKKFLIEKLNTTAQGGPTMTIKYSSWTDGAWTADQNPTFPYSENEGTGFIYYSLDTNSTVVVAPSDNAWDFVFSKYYDEVPTQNGPVMYNVTGALHNIGVSIAAVDEAGAVTEFSLPAEDAYSEDINSIGDKWKVFNQVVMGYDIPEKTYYVKTADDKIYRLYFLSFAGQSTGALSFKYKDVTPTAGVGEFENNNSFSIYPNPSVNKNVTVALNSTIENANVSVYSITGAKVFETSLTSNNQELNLSSLNSGIYLVRVEAGKYTEVKRLVIQ